jgi:hypothetical protein
MVMACLKQGYSSNIRACRHHEFVFSFLLLSLYKRVHLRLSANLRRTSEGDRALQPDAEMEM